jgi:diketogulonate reductase-like aldo/keto reductase
MARPVATLRVQPARETGREDAMNWNTGARSRRRPALDGSSAKEATMQRTTLLSGRPVPVLGLGTWHMGESRSRRDDEVKALQLGLDLGLTLIDTAEMYGEGGAEEVVGAAIRGRREGLTIVSKVYPHNASRKGAIAACERSLKRLGIETIDLYLLHWRGNVPLAETVAAFETLKRDGKIGAWGVSNFDSGDMRDLKSVAQGDACAANQVLYNLGERGIEFALLEQCRANNIAVMAYTPLGQGSILRHSIVKAIAEKHGVDGAAIALAFVLRHAGVIAIPKAVEPQHVRANARALEVALDADDLARLDAAFPPPRRATPLAML